MKKTNRVTVLFTAAVLSLSLAACGGTEAGDPLLAAQQNMSAASSMEAAMTTNLEMEIAGESIKTVTNMDVTVFAAPMRMKVEATTEALGENAIISVYAEETDNGSYMMYMNDGTGWHSTTASAEDLAQYEVNQNMSAFIESASSFQQEGIETMNGVSAYKYTGVITGQNMKDVMLESGVLDSLTSLGVSEDKVEGMLSDLGDISVALWISEEDLYPIRYDMDMTAIMDGLMKGVMESFGGQVEGLTMSIPEMTTCITCSNFNNAAEFSIPEEATQTVNHIQQ